MNKSLAQKTLERIAVCVGLCSDFTDGEYGYDAAEDTCDMMERIGELLAAAHVPIPHPAVDADGEFVFEAGDPDAYVLVYPEEA